MNTATGEVAQAATGESGTRFNRALLKLSGEALLGGREYGIDPKTVTAIAEEIVAVHGAGTQLAVVVGAGNIYRGMAAASEGMDRATADYAGMLATLLNALSLQDALERHGVHTRVQSAITVSEVISCSSPLRTLCSRRMTASAFWASSPVRNLSSRLVSRNLNGENAFLGDSQRSPSRFPPPNARACGPHRRTSY